MQQGSFRAEGWRGRLVRLTLSGRMDAAGFSAALTAHAPPGAPGLLMLTPRAARQTGLGPTLDLKGWGCVEGAPIAGLRAWRCAA